MICCPTKAPRRSQDLFGGKYGASGGKNSGQVLQGAARRLLEGRPFSTSLYHRDYAFPNHATDFYGFRCASDVEQPERRIVKRVLSCAAVLALALLARRGGFAIDSYRYLHVSIETPWTIFLFLLVAVFVPFILMLVLMWRRPTHKPHTASEVRRTSDE